MKPSRIPLFTTATLLLLGISVPGYAQEAQPAQSGAVKSAGGVNQSITKFTPNITVSSLAGRPDSDLVELQSGRRVTVGTLRRLDALAQKMRAATPRVARDTATLRVKPAATGTPLHNAADLAAALKRPDNETVQLPSGRRVTVGQIKLLQPFIEKKLGRPLTALPQRPNRTGPAIKITSQPDRAAAEKYWRDILLQKPDSTVLENTKGERITVGELKQYFAARAKARPAAPTKATPTPAPPQGQKGRPQ
jgi:hypothetical protein